MRKQIRALLFVFGCISPLFAQGPALVTATVQSASGGQPYFSGTYQISLVDASGNPLQVSGYQSQFTGTLSTAGLLSLSLYPNTTIQTGSQWKFQICSAVPNTLSIPSPAPSASCFSLAVTISSAGDISSTLNASAPVFNACTQWSGSAWQACSSGGGGGSGTVTTVSVATANGVSGTVANPTTTPAITLALGAITPTSTNGVSAATMAFVDPTSSIQTQLNGKQGSLTLTTTGSSGASTLTGSTLNIPQYSGGGGSGTVSGQAAGVIPLGTTATAISNQSHLDDGNTTVGTITSSEPLSAPSVATTGTCGLSGSGTGLGCVSFAQASLPSAGAAGQDYLLGGTAGLSETIGTAAPVALLYNGGALGTPSGGTATNLTGLPVAGIVAIGANTTIANVTSGSASPTAASIPAGVQFYTSGTGYSAATSANLLGVCTTCVVASSPGVGLAHFAGSTQTVTSSTVATADIAANAVTLAKLATQAANTVTANVTSGSAVPTAAAIPSGIQNYVAGTGYNQASGHQLQVPLACPDSSGSGTAQSCSTGGTTYTPAAYDCILYSTTTTNSGAGLTTNVDSLGAKSIAIPGSSGWTTTLTASIIPANKPQLFCYDGTDWDDMQTGTSSAGSGNTTSTTLTSNVMPKANGANSIINSSVTDNATTVTSTDAGGYVAPVFVANGTTAGFFDFPQGTTSAAVTPCNTANSVCLQSPTSVTSQLRVFASAPATGVSLYTNSSGTMTETILPVTGSGPNVQSALTAGAPTYTPGASVTSCAQASGYTNSNERGEVTIVGGTATTGTICTVNFSVALASAPGLCQVTQNGGTTVFSIGHGTPGTSSFTITAGISVVSSTLNVDYDCAP